jgi:hypothetical protein
MKIEIRDERASDFALFLKRMTYEDAYRRTDSGYTEEKRKEQAYRFLEGAADVENSIYDGIQLKREQEEKLEQETQGRRR